ncbi:MAG: hypothetical protein WKF65_08665 [Gaiellaceae bacterium]
MTSIAAWVGVDTHGPASLYIATDSRISWGSSKWDFGRKAFASQRLPFIFGYVGVVLFPSLILSQFVSALDVGARDPKDFDEMLAQLVGVVKLSHPKLPRAEQVPLEIVACGRDGNGMRAQFRAVVIGSVTPRKYTVHEVVFPLQSDLVVNEGSGRASVESALTASRATAAEGTSRAIFAAFAQAIATGADPNSGGAPQLAGLYRIGGGRTFGVVDRGKRYLHGLPVSGRPLAESLEWRNELFERCDGATGKRLPDAQKH